MPASKVMIIGLDCAEPSLVLERWRDELPTLSRPDGARRLRPPDLRDPADHGSRVVLHDVEPHARRPRRLRLPQPLRPLLRRALHRQRDGDQGAPAVGPRRRGAASASIVLGVPGTYPPRPLNGVHGHVLPDAVDPSASTPIRRCCGARSSRSVGEYLFDCTDFRTEDKDDLLRQVYEMTDRRFALADHLLRDQAVGALRDGRDGHRPHAPRVLEGHGPRAPQARARRPLRGRDPRLPQPRRRAWSATLLEHADDDTAVLVVSDHGAKRMDGGIRVNEWLRREGLLATLREPNERVLARRRRRRLAQDDRLGRRRLLRPRSS